VAADRMDRQRLLMASQMIMAVAALLFALLVALDWVQVWHAMVFSFVMGCGFAGSMPVRQSLIANTVPNEELGNAIALNAMANNASRVVGPAAGGMLIMAFGTAGNFLLQAVLYLCMVAIIFPMKVPYRDTGSAGQSSPLDSLKEGAHYVWSNKIMLGLMMLSFIPSLCVMPVLQILPVFTDEALHAKADVYGYLVAFFGIGGLLATFLQASFGNAIRSGRLGMIALLCTLFFVVVFSQSTMLWAALPLIGVIGFAMMTFRVNNNTLVLTLSPDELRGRVMSIYMIDHALAPLASVALGYCADLFSTPTAMAALGGLGLAVTLILITSVKQMRDLRTIRA
jgi:MFS family permease